jgi:hypothetical protein
VNEQNIYEECNDNSNMMLNPVLRGIGIAIGVVGIVAVMLTICLCKRYRKLKI